MELRTHRLVLRRPTAADLPAVARECADPEIARFIPFIPVPYSLADAESWLANVDAQWERGTERTFAIADAETAALLGVVTIRLREGGSVGYWTARDARGRGVMTEAVTAVVAQAREQGIRRLFLTTHLDNLASQRVAEKTGFVRVGETEHLPPFRDGSTTAALFELRL
jgi:RimJ/RimL family protein N-acetyltransferase